MVRAPNLIELPDLEPLLRATTVVPDVEARRLPRPPLQSWRAGVNAKVGELPNPELQPGQIWRHQPWTSEDDGGGGSTWLHSSVGLDATLATSSMVTIGGGAKDILVCVHGKKGLLV